MHLSLRLQSGRPRFAGVLFLSPLFLLEARLCHHSVALNFKTNDAKSCVCLVIATHPFPGRGRLRKRERSLVWDGIQWAPQNLLYFSKNYVLWDFLDELLNSLFPPQVNKDCLLQEDAMRDSLRLFRIFFRSRGDPHHAKSHYRKRKADYRICIVPPWALLCCVSPYLYVHMYVFQWSEIHKLRGSLILFFLLVWTAGLHMMEKENRRCDIYNRTMIAAKSQCVVIAPIGLLGTKLRLLASMSLCIKQY